MEEQKPGETCNYTRFWVKLQTFQGVACFHRPSIVRNILLIVSEAYWAMSCLPASPPAVIALLRVARTPCMEGGKLRNQPGSSHACVCTKLEQCCQNTPMTLKRLLFSMIVNITAGPQLANPGTGKLPVWRVRAGSSTMGRLVAGP